MGVVEELLVDDSGSEVTQPTTPKPASKKPGTSPKPATKKPIAPTAGGIRLKSPKAGMTFGPDADVKLYRSGPGTVSIDAVMLNVLGELRSQGLKVDGMSIDQLIRKILQEIMEKDQD